MTNMTVKDLKKVHAQGQGIGQKAHVPSRNNFILGLFIVLISVVSFIGGCLTGAGYARLYPHLMRWLGQ